MYTLPDLPYDLQALEPYISGDIMKLHYTKHHQGYIDKLNDVLAGAPQALKGLPLVQLLRQLDQVPGPIRTAVRNQGGGHYNHSLFWQCMTPGGRQLQGELAKQIAKKYGSFEEFQRIFTERALGVFGSGWVWLMPDLSITTTANQDSPVMDGQDEPILALDVWEHAYYLDYKNVRADYITQWWRVVNWSAVADRYRAMRVE